MSSVSKFDGYHLWLATQYWQRSFNKLLKPYDVTHAQYFILDYMVWAEKKWSLSHLSQNQLAQRLSLDAMMISNVLRALETKWFITRAAAESWIQSQEKTNKWTLVLGVTEEGKSLIKSLQKQVKKFEKWAFSDTHKKFSPSLQSMVENLSE